MNVLVFTNMYPWDGMPFYGSFVRDEVEALRAAGIDVDLYFVNGRRNKASYLGMPFGFFSRLRRRHYDLVHVHHSYCGFIATMQRSIPVVWTFHEGEIMSDAATARDEGPTKKLIYWPAFKRRIARRVDALIVVAEFLKGPLGRGDAITLPSGIDMNLFRPMDSAQAREELGLSGDRRYILFPSSPARVEKRFALARAAVDRLREGSSRFQNVELVCLDNVPHDRVPLYMNASELMLMTSAFEASPVTLRESLACDVPVISTDVGDARVILEGIDGCRVVEADATEIARALAEALAAPRRVDGRSRVAPSSLENTTLRLLEVYREVVNQ